MTKTRTKRIRGAVALAVGLAAIIGPLAAHSISRPTITADDSAALKQFKAAGKTASLTVLPARIGDRSIVEVGEVVGLFLEKAGMSNLEIGTDALRLPENADMALTEKALGEFVKANPPKTDYTLFVDFIVSPERRFSEVRSVIVNKAGEVVWEDRQTASEADFRRLSPKEPMQCCLLVAQRLRPVLSLNDPTGRNAQDGKIAKRLSERSGVPSKQDFAAMQDRQRAFKKAAATATMLVYPGRAGDELSSEGATNISKLINEAKLTKATAANSGPAIKAKGDINEQKVLWSMANAFRDHVRKQPPDADYVLYTDYLMNGEKVGAVHFAVCDRQGQLIIADYQNEHHADFKAIAPKSRADADRLVVKRLQGYCN